MASDRCGGGGAIERDWAGGGYSSVSGAFHRWEARPPSASNGDKARELPIGPRPRRPVSPERDRDRVRLSLNRAAHRTLAENDRAERWLRRNGIYQRTPDVVRRSATLSNSLPVWRGITPPCPHLTATRSVAARGRNALSPPGEDDREAVRRGQVFTARPVERRHPMVQPRSKRLRPARLKRAMRNYVRARFKVGFIRAAIANFAQIRRDHPRDAQRAILFLPAWVRQMALDGIPPPEPDMWSFYWRGRGQKNRGEPTPPASAARDRPPSSPHSPRRRHRPGSRGSGRGCP